MDLFLVAAALAVGGLLAGTLATVELLPDAEPWHLLGGLGSALSVTAGILQFPRLGAVASVGCS